MTLTRRQILSGFAAMAVTTAFREAFAASADESES